MNHRRAKFKIGWFFPRQISVKSPQTNRIVERPHQGRWCYGKTPRHTFIDGAPLAREKMLDGTHEGLA
jgi:hypothetical protein